MKFLSVALNFVALTRYTPDRNTVVSPILFKALCSIIGHGIEYRILDFLLHCVPQIQYLGRGVRTAQLWNFDCNPAVS
jgi:hypothetical protein